MSALTTYETEYFKNKPATEKNPFAFPGETPAVLRLVKNASSVFHPHKQESNWKRVVQWNAYRENKGIKENVVHFEHARAGIVFPGATRVLFLSKHMEEFLKDETSSIHQSMRFDLRHQLCFEELCAVAVFDVEVVDPLWRSFYGRVINGKYVKATVHILDMVDIIKSLRDYLQKMTGDSSSMLSGDSPFDPGFLEQKKVERVIESLPSEVTTRYKD